MLLRKDVNVYVYDPWKKFFQMVVELKNVPGALSSVLGVLQNLNLNVLGSFSSVTPYAGTGVWSAFVEDSRHTASELKEKVSSSRYVLDSIVVESKEGFLVDSVHFPLSWNTGDRAVMMRAKYLGRMLDKMREKFGTGGEVIIYEEGFVNGKESLADFAARVGAGFMRSNLRDVLKMYQALGWFKLEGVDQSERDRTVTMRTSGSFECEGRKSTKPYSHFVRGQLCGALTAILGEEMECEEVKCIAMGDQRCEFVLRHKESADRLAEPMSIPER
ncbi:MAG: hypothetical protein LYZ66_02780 [Nitrososphaerales archaeon]|nr:hypothetical protein [Nitrososphaerales archaeon]